HSDAPKIAVNSNQTVHLVFGESPSGPLQYYHVEYTKSDQGLKNFSEPIQLSRRKSGTVLSSHFPSLELDGHGNPIVQWELFRDKSRHPKGLRITYSPNQGDTFLAPIMVPKSNQPEGSFNGSQQGLLREKVAVNEQGEIAVVNSTFLENVSSDIWLWRGSINKEASKQIQGGK
ncbi:MAG: hypothetical protein ABEJ65_11325, partial [bacterium]